MQQIAALIAGVRGAELGTASLYKRGTSTRASWFATFEALSPNSTGADISLDSHGGAEVYVNELVTVVVKDAAGTTVREFVAGESAAASEVITQSFSGTDYDSGATGAGYPTTVQAVLDSVETSFGSTDWNVLVGGTSISVQNAMASTSLFVNVKAPQYGAIGDGTADDTSAINAALTAADTIGNATVYFPPGTYKISSTLNVPSSVNLLGTTTDSDENFSKIKRSTSSFNILTFASGSTPAYRVENIEFQDAETGTNQAFFNLPIAARLDIIGCTTITPTGSSVSGARLFTATAGSVHAFRCSFFIKGGAAVPMIYDSSAARFTAVDCNFTLSDGTPFLGSYELRAIAKIVGCHFQVNTASANKPTQLLDLYGGSAVVGNSFTTALTSPDTVVAIGVDGSGGGASENAITESGNVFSARFSVGQTNNGYMISRSQTQRVQRLTIGAPGSLAIDPSLGHFIIVTTTGAAGTYTMAVGATGPRSSEMTFIIRNTSANNHTIDFSGTSPADTGVALNAATRSLRVLYRSTTDGTTSSWFRVTAFTVVAP